MPRLYSLALLLPALSGCSTTCFTPARAPVCPAPYSRVTATDMQGRVISEYIAGGPVVETCEGLTFTALERRVLSGPYKMTRCYPLGRPVEVRAPNVIATPIYSLEASSLASK